MSGKWLPAALTVAALVVCYAPYLGGLFEQWMYDEDMGHGSVVPFVMGWIIWRERERWRGQVGGPDHAGFLIMAFGAALHLAGALGGGVFAATLGLLVSGAGAVVVFGGFALLRAWSFPFVLSLFMLPKLAIVYNQTTLPLQLLASKLAAQGLTTAGLGVLREGNILTVNGISVAVDEACSGLRFLLPLGFLSLVYSYLAGGRPWMVVVSLAFSIPMAVVANAIRVGLSAVYPSLATGARHQAIGWALFLPCLGGLALLQWALGRMQGERK
jgi:exosortase